MPKPQHLGSNNIIRAGKGRENALLRDAGEKHRVKAKSEEGGRRKLLRETLKQKMDPPSYTPTHTHTRRQKKFQEGRQAYSHTRTPTSFILLLLLPCGKRRLQFPFVSVK